MGWIEYAISLPTILTLETYSIKKKKKKNSLETHSQAPS